MSKLPPEADTLKDEAESDAEAYIIRRYRIFFKSGEHLEFQGQWNPLYSLPGPSALLQDYRDYLDHGNKPNPPKRYVVVGSQAPHKAAEFMLDFDEVISISIIYDEGLVNEQSP